MIRLVQLPSTNPNDESAKLVSWRKGEAEFVQAGEVICTIETTKAAVEVEAPVSGYLVRLRESGWEGPVGTQIAALTSTLGEDVGPALNEGAEPANDAPQRRWTKKAFLVARRAGIDLDELARRLPGRLLTEADVLAAQEPDSAQGDLVDTEFPSSRPERVLLLGGGGGAGTIAMDAVLRGGGKQRVVAILDNNPKLAGKASMGVPILGSLALIDELAAENRFDAAVLLVTEDLEERAALFNDLRARNIRFTNIVDPSVQIRSYVQMGVGNVIMGNGFFAVGVRLGDNNFFASQNVVEHHSTIGSHCAFGPRCTLSGKVTVGDRVRFGMHVAVEPYVNIGADSVVASGVVLTTHLAERSIAKSSAAPTIREI